MLLISIIQVCPGFKAIARLWIGAATTKERPQEILLNVFYILKCILLRLSHLADLFIQRHPCKKLTRSSIVRHQGLSACHSFLRTTSTSKRGNYNGHSACHKGCFDEFTPV